MDIVNNHSQWHRKVYCLGQLHRPTACTWGGESRPSGNFHILSAQRYLNSEAAYVIKKYLPELLWEYIKFLIFHCTREI